MVGYILTEVINYPRAKAVRFLCLTAIDIKGFDKFLAVIGEWVPFVKQVEEWAKGIGCVLSQIESPATWELFMKDYGYRRTHVYLDRELV